MPMIMWAEPNHAKLENNKDLKELLAEICKETGGEWTIEEYHIERKRWFSKTQKSTVFSLYAKINYETGAYEWQRTNFAVSVPNNPMTPSLNYAVDECHLINYFNGILTGIKDERRKS